VSRVLSRFRLVSGIIMKGLEERELKPLNIQAPSQLKYSWTLFRSLLYIYHHDSSSYIEIGRVWILNPSKWQTLLGLRPRSAMVMMDEIITAVTSLSGVYFYNCTKHFHNQLKIFSASCSSKYSSTLLALDAPCIRTIFSFKLLWLHMNCLP